jgi:alkyl hydroperoxide reductase subunit AhpC
MSVLPIQKESPIQREFRERSVNLNYLTTAHSAAHAAWKRAQEAAREAHMAFVAIDKGMVDALSSLESFCCQHDLELPPQHAKLAAIIYDEDGEIRTISERERDL